MSKLRPECGSSTKPSLPRETLLFLIGKSVARRRELIYGRLHGPSDGHCAMGAFWADNPKLSVPDDLVDEVAAVNDSVPPTSTPKERWKVVNSWLRFKLRALTGQETKPAHPALKVVAK